MSGLDDGGRRSVLLDRLPAVAIASSHAHTTRWPGTLSLPPRMVVEMLVELSPEVPWRPGRGPVRMTA